MSRPTLYSGPLSMFGAKVQIAALEKGLDFELVMVPFDSVRGYEPKHPEVLRINPKRQVPVLVDGDLEIFDSSQILNISKISSPFRRCGPWTRRRGHAHAVWNINPTKCISRTSFA